MNTLLYTLLICFTCSVFSMDTRYEKTSTCHDNFVRVMNDQTTYFSCIPRDIHTLILPYLDAHNTFEKELKAFNCDDEGITQKFFKSDCRNYLIRNVYKSYIREDETGIEDATNFSQLLLGILDGALPALTKTKDFVSTVLNGYQLIHFAAHMGNQELVARLLENGAHIDSLAYDSDGAPLEDATPIHCAAYQGHSALVQWFINNGAKIRRKFRVTLYAASKCKDIDLVKRLIDKGAGYESCNASVPLFYALDEKSYDALPMLLEAGLDVNGCPRPNHFSLLAKAVSMEEEDATRLHVLELLLKNGARFKPVEVMNEIRKIYIAYTQPLRQLFVPYYHKEIMELLFQTIVRSESQIPLSHFFDVSLDLDAAEPKTGFTALIYAARYSNIDVIERLIAAGVDTQHKDPRGKTAFDHAKPGSLIRVMLENNDNDGPAGDKHSLDELYDDDSDDIYPPAKKRQANEEDDDSDHNDMCH